MKATPTDQFRELPRRHGQWWLEGSLLQPIDQATVDALRNRTRQWDQGTVWQIDPAVADDYLHECECGHTCHTKWQLTTHRTSQCRLR